MDIPARERLIVALDVPTVTEARALVERLGDSVVFYKIGKQQIFAGGIELAKELLANGKKVFLDAKLNDIGATVQKATENIVKLGVDFLTIHGDAPAIRAAVAGRGGDKLKIFGVTVLTSLDQNDLADMGFDKSLAELIDHRARKVKEAGGDGVIASGHEAARIRQMAGDDFLIITPGIRPAGTDAGDQKRVMTPARAIAAGADYLVVGRPITQAGDPKAAAEAIVAEIKAAL